MNGKINRKVKVSELNVKDIVIHPLKPMTSKGKTTAQKCCKITFNTSTGDKPDPVCLVFSRSRAPFGISDGYKGDEKKKQEVTEETTGEKKKEEKKYSMSIDISDEDRQKLQELDDYIVSYIAEHSGEEDFFGETCPVSFIRRNNYGSFIKKNKDPKYKDRVNFKIPVYKDHLWTLVYDPVTRERLDVNMNDLSWFPKFCSVDVLAEIDALYFVGAKFYLTFKARQLRVHPAESEAECALDDDEQVDTSNDAQVPDDE